MWSQEYGHPLRRVLYYVPSVALPSSPGHPESLILPGGHFEARHRIEGRSLATIDVLPEVALLEIFDFCVGEPWSYGWIPLLHVCRTWRYLVFGSPRRLRLQLRRTASELMKKTLDIWPPLPIAINVLHEERWEVDDILPTLEHKDRLCELKLPLISNWKLEKVLAVMHQPFPILTCLKLGSYSETVLVDPDSFLGGSAPLLQSLTLEGITFPELPKLLLSATYLVTLHLWGIPYSSYTSPEAMVIGLSVLTRLESLFIKFGSPRGHPDPDQNTRRPPPQTRTLLPVLIRLEFDGSSEYLEDLVARIDTPRLDDLEILFFHQLMFDTPQLAQFISRTPNFEARNEARVTFSVSNVWITFPPINHGRLVFVIVSDWLELQVSSLAQVCSSSFPQDFIPAVEHLYILGDRLDLSDDDVEDSDAQWLELLRPFTAVEGLYIPCKMTACIAPVLLELVGERATEVLPALQTLFLKNPDPWGPDRRAIVQFVDARQLASHPIIVCLEIEGEEEWY